MSILDKLKGMVRGHPDKAREGVEQAGDLVDEKTQGKYRSQTDAVQKKINEQFGSESQQPPGGEDQPPSS